MNLKVTHMFCISVIYSDIVFVKSVSCIDTPIDISFSFITGGSPRIHHGGGGGLFGGIVQNFYPWAG